MEPYGLLGRLVAKPGQRAALVDLLLEAADLLRTAPGCRQWIVHEPLDAPDAVWIAEVWDTEDDHDASLQRADVRAIVGRAMPLLSEAPAAGHSTRVRGGVGL